MGFDKLALHLYFFFAEYAKHSYCKHGIPCCGEQDAG